MFEVVSSDWMLFNASSSIFLIPSFPTVSVLEMIRAKGISTVFAKEYADRGEHDHGCCTPVSATRPPRVEVCRGAKAILLV